MKSTEKVELFLLSVSGQALIGQEKMQSAVLREK